MNRTSLRKLGLIVAVAAACVIATSDNHVSADPIRAGALHRGAHGAKKVARQVFIDHIDVVRSPSGTPFGGIAPCVIVGRPIWNAAQGGTPYSLQFHFRYQSKKHHAAKNVQIPLKNMRIAHEYEKDPRRFVALDTVVDVSNKPVKAGTAVTGRVRLKKQGSPAKASAEMDDESMELVGVELVLDDDEEDN